MKKVDMCVCKELEREIYIGSLVACLLTWSKKFKGDSMQYIPIYVVGLYLDRSHATNDFPHVCHYIYLFLEYLCHSTNNTTPPPSVASLS